MLTVRARRPNWSMVRYIYQIYPGSSSGRGGGGGVSTSTQSCCPPNHLFLPIAFWGPSFTLSLSFQVIVKALATLSISVAN